MPTITKVDPRTWSTVMEQLQEGYISAIAATAAATVERVGRDYFGYDVELKRQPQKASEAAAVRLQLKATTAIVPPTSATSSITFSLKRPHFDSLAVSNRTIQHILVVMVVHPNQNKWSFVHHRGTVLKHCCYWINLAGCTVPTTPINPNIAIPTTQIFNAKSLTGILDRIEAGGNP